MVISPLTTGGKFRPPDSVSAANSPARSQEREVLGLTGVAHQVPQLVVLAGGNHEALPPQLRLTMGWSAWGPTSCNTGLISYNYLTAGWWRWTPPLLYPSIRPS